ncbi:MAG: glycine cleavage system aminomethyltransferase GcvT [Lachnospiraceae bacterium]|nr:glycine cleavage system aminomethyltransferase GcvT [Lachnospiraceae bacterium]
MSELKQTVLHDVHVELGAKMVDFSGWDMPIQYPCGIVEEHLKTRQGCGIFDVSHMGRLVISGPQMVEFLQHVLSSDVEALELNQAQYCIIPNETGGAVDDAYLYRYEEGNYFLVINAANIDKDKEHLFSYAKDYDVMIEDVSDRTASISIQGPKSKEILISMLGGQQPTEDPSKNALATTKIDGIPVRIAKTGYTGEPLGYEIFAASEQAEYFWKKLMDMGAHPAALGARDTLRLEAALPLYGHEMGINKYGEDIPIFAVPLAKFAVSFAENKGDFVGRKPLEKQAAAFRRILNRDFAACADLPYRIRSIALLEKGVLRAGFPVYRDGEEVGYVTSGTMVPYFNTEGEGMATEILDEMSRRSIGLAYLKSDLINDDHVQIDVRGKKLDAVVVPYHMRTDAPPFARPILWQSEEEEELHVSDDYAAKAAALLKKAADNQVWRQSECVNLIPSEMTASPAVHALCASDPCNRYAEHKKVRAFYDSEVFYYQGTKFIEEVECLLVDEMRKYLGCTEVETRVTSGQMANTAVFSALMDFKNRVDRKVTPKRLGYIMNNHIIRGGHLSAQPMGALHDYIAVDPVTEKPALVNFPVCADNPYKIDVEAAKELLLRYRPELIIFGKSMVLHKEPVAEIRKFVDEQGIQTTIMYDMAHVLGLVGDHFQKPFEEGAEIVTGSTHKTFFGPQRGVIGTNWKKEDLKYGLWETIETRAFPGSVSNHHLGTQLGMLMAAYEMNAFKDAYQKAVIHNAKYFAKCLKEAGMEVAGDPAIDYTETHQVIASVGYGQGYEVAERLERNNIIVNYQATPDNEGFTASGALRMGVSEMTRFGFSETEFKKLAELMADCVLHGTEVGEEVKKLRAGFTEPKYCFTDAQMEGVLGALSEKLGF